MQWEYRPIRFGDVTIGNVISCLIQFGLVTQLQVIGPIKSVNRNNTGAREGTTDRSLRPVVRIFSPTVVNRGRWAPLRH